MPSPVSRRTAILESAARAFSNFGLRGASLRYIAKDAGVSLTLLDHHFGAKDMLLAAVIDSHREGCARRIEPLRASLMALDRSLTASRLISEWVDYEFAASDTRQGRHDLNLALRLSADAEIDPALREDLHCSQRVVVGALRRLQPEREERHLRRTWRLASAALHAAIRGVDEFYGASDAIATADYRADTKTFLTEGLGRPPSNG